MTVVGESEDEAGSHAVIARLAPQVVVLGEAGVSRRSSPHGLRAAWPAIGVVVFANSPTRAYSARLVAAGAAICVPVNAAEEDIFAAIREAARRSHLGNHTDFSRLLGSLTAREREVFDLLCSGMSNAEIATELYISIHTAKVHVQHIFTKLAVNDREALIGISLPFSSGDDIRRLPNRY